MVLKFLAIPFVACHTCLWLVMTNYGSELSILIKLVMRYALSVNLE